MIQIQLPKKIGLNFATKARWRAFYGGRSSGKTRSLAIMALVRGAQERLNILCCREYETSIEQSFFKELKEALADNPELRKYYIVGLKYIRGINGTEFSFAGLRNEPHKIKSAANVNICIIDEAETIPGYAIDALEPTIRAEDSEIWVAWNPEKKSAYFSNRFLVEKRNQDNAVITCVNYFDNPFMPDVMTQTRLENKKAFSKEKYEWIWLGKFHENSDSLIFKDRFVIENFEKRSQYDVKLYQGMDFGFNDPMTLVISFIEDGVLYIQDEVYYTQVTPKDFVELADKKLGADWRKVETIADESQPAVIKELSRSGIKIRRSEKGAERGSGISKSSIINGIERLKAFDKIVIHKSCKNTIEEFQNYSFKTERATGIILDEPQDNYNHCIDALRYSLLKYRH